MCHDPNSRHHRSLVLLCTETMLLPQPYESYGRRYRMGRIFLIHYRRGVLRRRTRSLQGRLSEHNHEWLPSAIGDQSPI